MKKYIKPELKTEIFETEDIILASGNSGGSSDIVTPDIDGGDVTYLEEWIRSWTE